MKVSLFFRICFYITAFFVTYASFVIAIYAFIDYDFLTAFLPILIFIYFMDCMKIILKSPNIYYKNGSFYREKSDYIDKVELKKYRNFSFSFFQFIFIFLIWPSFIIPELILLLSKQSLENMYPNDFDSIYTFIGFYTVGIIFINYIYGFIHKYFIKKSIFKKINLWNIFIINLVIVSTTIRFYLLNLDNVLDIKTKNNFYHLLAVSIIILIIIFISLFKQYLSNKKITPKNEFLAEKTLNLFKKTNNLLKNISLSRKHSKVYNELFRVKKTLLNFTKVESMINEEFNQIDIEYFNFLQARFSELEELYFNKNFEIENYVLKDELKYIKYSSIYGF